MLVAPSPVFPLRIAVDAVPVAILLVPFLLKPVAISACFALIPLVVIATVAVIVSLRMFVLGDRGERDCKRRA